MNLNDPISDMFTRIRNAGRAMHGDVSMPASRLKAAIAEVLKKEGYIDNYRIDNHGRVKKTLTISLKYVGKSPVIEGISRISKLSRRVYVAVDRIPRIRGGLGIVILSTPKGVMTGRQARKLNVGGEVICSIW